MKDTKHNSVLFDDDCIGVDTYIKENDKTTRKYFNIIKRDIDRLAKKYPSMLEDEEYKQLMSDMITANTYLINETERKQKICKGLQNEIDDWK